MAILAACLAAGFLAAVPVIDMHVHSTNTPPEALAVRYAFVSGLAADLSRWAASTAAKDRHVPSLVFPCAGGRAHFVNRQCFDKPMDFPDPVWLRKEIEEGRIRGFGELAPQLMGISFQDPRFEPYWRLAEEFDIPVAVHMGPGPPGAAYESSPAPFKFPSFRMAFGEPMLLEEVLLRHKRLRLFVMHAGWPWLDSMAALLYAHPNVYVDVAALSAAFMTPRASYYRHLRGLAEAGFAKRIMFGSDFPDQVGPGVDAILAADFLTSEQKAGIVCGNAARFLRLDASVCRP